MFAENLIEDEGAEEIGALPRGPGSIAFVGNALPGGGLNGFGLVGRKPHGPGFEMVGSRVAKLLRLLDGHEPLRAHGGCAEQNGQQKYRAKHGRAGLVQKKTPAPSWK